MGIEIDRTEFQAADFATFAARLDDSLATLATLLETPGFGRGEASLGAELEMYIVDDRCCPLPINQELLNDAQDPSLTLELNRYNLEYNLHPYQIKNGAFFSTEAEILDKLELLNTLAEKRGARIVPIGILPTLQNQDFGLNSVTDRVRYHALREQLNKATGQSFEIHINGLEPLRMAMDDISLEGANTSFQVHYRVSPERFAAVYNSLQLVTPLCLALAANSPSLFGHRLWQETRIPLFKQSIDTRDNHRYSWRPPPRVNFGNGWLRNGAWEVFAENVRLYPPLLPICGEQISSTLVADGAPKYAELRLHQSTVWSWNRAVYDDADAGHLRIELRAFPAGPSAVDMVAVAAFAIGLAEGLAESIDELLPALPFALAEYNFYRAAQFGLAAEIAWPDAAQHGLHTTPVRQLMDSVLPKAHEGLRNIGVGNAEADYYLANIEKRIDCGVTGASWQLNCLDKLQRSHEQGEALRLMTERYQQYSRQNLSIVDWPE